jgi:large subunit ribosomal protein L23
MGHGDMKAPSEVIIRPLITEKGTNLAQQDKYTFQVAPRANKIEIRTAVERMFKVNVLDVNVSNVKGERKRRGRFWTKTPNWRKAVVTVRSGQSIEIFRSV